jgi:soluble lytic murein transglycosylase-like protein
MAKPAARHVVSAAQGLLKLEHPELVVDGVWGADTQRSYANVPLAARSSVNQMIEGKGYTVQELAGSQGQSVDRVAIIELSKRIAMEEGVPPDLIRKVGHLESKFNPGAKSNTGYVGVMQLGTLSMTEAYRLKPDGLRWVQAGRNASGPLVRLADPFDPEQNIRAGCRFLKVLCERYLKVKMIPENYVRIYMAYNIGVNGANNVLNGRPQLAMKEIAANPVYGGGNPAKYREALTTAVMNA